MGLRETSISIFPMRKQPAIFTSAECPEPLRDCTQKLQDNYSTGAPHMWKPYLCLCMQALLCSQCAGDRWYGQAHLSQTWCYNAIPSLCGRARFHMNSTGYLTDCLLYLACLQTMPANPTVVHLHAKILAFCNITQWKPCNIHVYKPYSCSPARKNVCFLNQYSMQTLQHTCTQMHGFNGYSHGKPWHKHVYKPYSCSIACKNAWFLWWQPYRRARMHIKHEGKHTSELNVCKTCRTSQVPYFPASYRTAI